MSLFGKIFERLFHVFHVSPFSRDVTKCFHKWQRRTGWQENRFSYSNNVKLAYFTLLPFKNR